MQTQLTSLSQRDELQETSAPIGCSVRLELTRAEHVILSETNLETLVRRSVLVAGVTRSFRVLVGLFFLRAALKLSSVTFQG